MKKCIVLALLLVMSSVLVVCAGELPHRILMDRPAGAPKLEIPRFDRIDMALLQDGSARVIVRLTPPDDLVGGFAVESGIKNRDSVTRQREAIARKQGQVLGKISQKHAARAKRFDFIPYLAMEIDPDELQALTSSPDVDYIQEDTIVYPVLRESIPLIGGVGGSFSGATGADQTVAILDTGVDKTHPFLTGKVVDEACYSTIYSPYAITSLCPNGLTSMTGSGAGINCSSSLNGCYHGTHVAGIIAGTNASFSGVAKDADLISIQVFSRCNSATYCGGTAPCIMAFTSDLISALSRVYALKDSRTIASVNMSLGGGLFTTYCDAEDAATKAAIDTLRSAGIATIIASGNSYSSSSISFPACISSAISVGATTKSNVVDSYSNSAAILNLLAPGTSIYSSLPGTGYGYLNGTSMATPHVAGAWAVLKSTRPAATVTETLNALTTTGVPVTDTRNGLVKPRIELAAAVSALNTVSITVTTLPDGLEFTVDGQLYRGSQTFSWAPGSSHTISTTALQNGAAGIRHRFATWSDAGDLVHSVITPESATTYTANFSTEYQLSTEVTPPGAGSVTPASGAWYVTGTTVDITATAGTGTYFSGWLGPVADANSATTTVTMTGPHNVTATFTGFVATTVTTGTPGANSAPLILESSGNGTGYFTILAGNAVACGTGAQVKAGQDSTGAVAPYHGSLPLIAHQAGHYTVRNLTQNSSYTVCFTADSPTGANLNPLPVSADLVTATATTLTNPDWGSVGSTGFSTGAADHASLAFDPEGVPSVAFQDWGASGKATVMKFDGISWVTVGNAGFSAGQAGYVSLAFAPDGSPVVAYQDQSVTGKATVMRYDGASWQAVGSPGFSAGQADDISLAFAPDGAPSVAYRDGNAGNKATVMSYRNGVWSVTGDPGFSSGEAGHPSLAFARDGSPSLAFQDGSTGGKATVMKYDGASWVSAGIPGFSVGTATGIALAIAPDGSPCVVYQDGGNGGTATVMRYDGTSWLAVGGAGFSAGQAVDPSLAFAPDGNPVVAYQDTANGGTAVVKKYDGTSWSTVGSAGFSVGQAGHPSLAYAPDGVPFVAYQDGAESSKVTVMKLKNGTTITVATDHNPALAGETLTLTARVSPADATGTVTFKDGATELETVPLSGGAASCSTSLLGVGDHSITASYQGDRVYSGSTSSAISQTINSNLANVTITTIPPGLSITVDDTPSTTPQTFSWVIGSSHIIATASQNGSTGVRYNFTNWSDGGTISHSVDTPASGGSFTAQFATEYQLTTAVTPVGSGTVTPASGGWYASGVNVSLRATATAGTTFTGWTGPVIDPYAASTSVAMTGPLTVSAAFSSYAITTTTFASATVGVSYSKGQTVYGGVAPNTWSISAGALPPGIGYNTATGLVSGVPTLPGIYGFTFMTRDSSGNTATRSFTLLVNAAPLSISTAPSLPNGTYGVSYRTTLTGTGGVKPVVWSITSGNLPAGVGLNTATGVISGTPASAGTFSFTAQIKDGDGTLVTKDFTLTVVSAVLAITSNSILNSGTYGTSYSTSLACTGGVKPVVWSIINGALPPGIGLNTATGAISGTPASAGDFSFIAQVTDSTGTVASKSFSLTIAAVPLSISSATPLNTGTYGVSYSTTLAFTGGIKPVVWSIASGSLPPGVGLNTATGSLSGVPASAGTFSFTVQLKDSVGTVTTRTLSLPIASTTLAITAATPLSTGTVGVSYSKTLTVSGGVGPYSWSLNSGNLPTGIGLNTATGSLSGTPTAGGSFVMTFQVKDSLGTTATKEFTLNISIPSLAVTTVSPLISGTTGVTYSALISATGGVVPYIWTLVGGALPPGVGLTTTTGSISGKPTVGGIYSFTVQVKDSAGTTVTKPFSLTVN